MMCCENESLATWQIYQPLIVGLGAVVLATIGNTLLEWFRHHLTNTTLATNLRRALAEELRQAKDTADVNAFRSNESSEDSSYIIPLQEHYRIYDQSIGQLGLLKAEQISAVVHAYGMLHAQIEVVSVMGTLHRIEGAVLQAVVDGKWSEVLSGQSKNLSAALEKAIAALEKA